MYRLVYTIITPIHDFVPQTGLYHYITSPRLSGGAKPFFLSGAQS